MSIHELDIINGRPERVKRLDIDRVNAEFNREFGVDLIPLEEIEQVENLPVIPYDYRPLSDGSYKNTLTGEQVWLDTMSRDEVHESCEGISRWLK